MFALQQSDPREQEREHEEVIPSFDDEWEELRVECDQRDEREPVLGPLHEQRQDRERRDERGEVEVALIPGDAEVVEDPHERHGDKEERWEVREVVERGVVHHGPVHEWRIEVVRDVGVLSAEELARGPLDHERAVVDVRVRASGLSEHDRCDRRRDDE
ncbi:MAG: hypothetical protein E6J38_03345 [Chloroflexi bacterium]|nr:MAG: hypothetical protein E6J38_03345 [Chloroflexota bacterium]